MAGLALVIPDVQSTEVGGDQEPYTVRSWRSTCGDSSDQQVAFICHWLNRGKGGLGSFTMS